MEVKKEVLDQVSGPASEWVKNLEEKGMAMAESLNRIVRTVESIVDSFSQFFDTVKQQKDNVLELGHRAGEKIKPVTTTGISVLNSSRRVGGRLITKSRENPLPFLLGGLAIVGGIAVLAYYLNEEKSRVGGSSLKAS